MCGIVGVVAKDYVNQTIFDALTVMQHRGQDAAGIATSYEGKVTIRKENGLVREVIRTRHMKKLIGTIGIGHVRYPTAGTACASEAQPFYVNSPYGIALAHNGNLINTQELIKALKHNDLRHLNTHSDSEVLLNVFAHELQVQKVQKPTAKEIFHAVKQVHRRIRGGYAVIALITGYGIVGFRDPNGIRPLVYGSRETAKGKEYMIASESTALDICGYSLERDVGAGEAIFITADGQFFSEHCADITNLTPCLFEYVYLARPDAILDGVAVYHARMKQGIKLAEKFLRQYGTHHDIDVIIPIPESGRIAGNEMAKTLGIPVREGFIKNHYIGRTFIMPNQKVRKKSVRDKLNPIRCEFKGKNVLLVDDSIVRGTTSRQIVELARAMGANKVYFASAAPVVRYPNIYGIDMPSVAHLIGHNHSEQEIADLIGADGIIFQDLEDLKASIAELNPRIKDFEASVFDGSYIVKPCDDEHFLPSPTALKSIEK